MGEELGKELRGGLGQAKRRPSARRPRRAGPPGREEEVSREGRMRKPIVKPAAIAAFVVLISLGLFVRPAMSHHSFAMYDQTKVVTWTGVLTRFVSQANHAEIHF